VVINATTGVLEINKIYLDVDRTTNQSRNHIRTIALPGELTRDNDRLKTRESASRLVLIACGNGGRQKRARIPDLERLEHVRSSKCMSGCS